MNSDGNFRTILFIYLRKNPKGRQSIKLSSLLERENVGKREKKVIKPAGLKPTRRAGRQHHMD